MLSSAQIPGQLLEQVHPTLNDSIDVSTLTPGSNKKIWWICPKGHEFQASIANRVKGTKCPICSGRKLLIGYNDLATTHPDLAAQWHPSLNEDITPEDVSAGMSKQVWWLCPKGHEYDAKLSNRTSNKMNCPYCAGKRIKAGDNDLATAHPEIAAQWHPTRNGELTPQQIGRGNKTRAWWFCNKGHEYDALVANRSAGMGCPFCAGKRVLAGYNDFAASYPTIALQWHPTKNENLTPQQVSRGSNKKVWWLCNQCQGEWEAVVANRGSHDTGCPFCAGQKVQAGLNDLSTTHPSLAAQWHSTLNEGFTAQMARMGSPANIWWQCERGHEWQARIRDRVLGGGCSKCYHLGLPTGSRSLRQARPDIAKQWDAQRNVDYTPDTIAHMSNRMAWWKCVTDATHSWQATVANRTSRNSECPVCWSKCIVSRAENDLYNILVALGETVERSNRTLLEGKSELDLYVADKKFAIEFNGCYWHSEAAGKSKWYHQQKWQKCQDAGITLFQVWEDDWNARREIVIRGIAHRLGKTAELSKVLPDLPQMCMERVGARKCTVKMLESKTANAFLEANHIQGKVLGSYYLGLMDKDDNLRAVLALTKTEQDGVLMISRYATAGTVVGGFTKLLSAAIKEYTPKQLVTFADLSISDGGLYESTGFTVDKVIDPDYSYLVNKVREHKFGYRIKRFKNDSKLLFEEGLTEAELADLNGLVRVWDSGKIRYILAP